MSPGPLVGSASHLDWHGPSGGTALRQQHGHGVAQPSDSNMWSLMATQAIDISLDSSGGKTTFPGIVPNNSLGLDVTMVPGGSTGYSDQYGTATLWLSNTNMASGGMSGCSYCLWWEEEQWTST